MIERLKALPDGALLGIDLDAEGPLAGEIAAWSDLTRNAIVAREPLPEGGERVLIRKGVAPAKLEGDLHGRRLWIYSNFDCNLACDYCCVRSSPHAERRPFGAARASALADEARRLGFTQILVTGGEPFVAPNVDALVNACARELPTTLLTNAMLFHGPRLAALERMPRDRVTLQVSLDSPTPGAHDEHRGAGSWQRARDGIAIARKLGFRVRVAATLATREEHEAMDAFLAGEGVPAEDRVLRPLARRGVATSGVLLARHEVVPEITATATGWYWHPVGATDDDFLVGPPELDLRGALDAVERALARDRAASTHHADIFRCA